MNQKLLYTILLLCQNLIICADNCSVFSCSQLKAETDKQCGFAGTTCDLYYTSCEKLSSSDCTSTTIKVNKQINQKCALNAQSKCETVDILCSEYSSSLPTSPLTCEDLKASEGKYCITVGSKCKEESGCKTDSETCSDHKPLDSKNKWDHLSICKSNANNQCISELKKCDEIQTEDGDICEQLSTSDNTKKKCFKVGSDCQEKFIDCESYTEDTDCTGNEITAYIKDSNINKCVWKESKCSTARKECSDFNSETLCNSYTPENTSTKCFYGTIKAQTKCHQLYKTCSGYNSVPEADRVKEFCEAIVEDLYSKCVFESNTCVKKENKCEDYHSDSSTCTTTQISDSYKCDYDSENSKCIKVKQYKNCNLYTENDRITCERIIPPESNKRCILKNDKECISVPKECEDYNTIVSDINKRNEYECVNNYKPLDENYKCIFKNNQCQKTLNYDYCSDYLGTDATDCSSIIPKNEGENYSIKCKINNFNDYKCIRVEKPCSDGNGNDPEACSLIIPKDSKKKCILKGSTCTEEYKTCKDYNDDENIEKIISSDCTSITSDDGKKCKYTEGTAGNTRGTCASEETYKCDTTDFDLTKFKNACYSVQLSDISKQCIYNDLTGECSMKAKTCLELTFKGNENNIENICKSAEASEGKKCIISQDKTHCLEVDSSLVPEDAPNTTNAPMEENKDQQTQAQEDTEENKPDSGKVIYMNILLIFILCFLF